MPPSSSPASATPRRRTGRARSLAKELRERTDAELAALLAGRPDLARPAPADLTTLAARAGTPASARRALDDLDTAHLRALQAAALCPEPIEEARGARLLGCPRRRFTGLCRDLHELALLWNGVGGLYVHRPVIDALGPHIAGLAPAAPNDEAAAALVADLAAAAPEAVVAAVATRTRPAPQGAAEILRRLTWGPPNGTLDPTGPLGAASRWLIEVGLLREGGEGVGSVILPRPIALALRGGRLSRHEDLDPPPVNLRPGEPAEIDAAGGIRAGEFLALVEDLLERWGAEPPRVLRSGGLAVRDFTRLSTRLDLRPHEAALLVEVVRAAGLVREDGAYEPAWAPTPAAEEWLAMDDARRWGQLVRAWLGMPAAPHLAGTRTSERPTAINALSADASWAAVRGVRRDVVQVLASVEPGAGLDATDVAARVRWLRPLRAAGSMDQAVTAVYAELELLGVTAGGALTNAGRLLPEAEDDDGARLEAAAAIPPPVEEVLLQADLTAVAPGRMTPRLASFLRLAADVESRGGATVYRFTPASLRRLLDEGWSVDDVLRTLSGASRTPIPQPLTYLVEDLGRRHGQARVGGARSYVRSDDVALLEDILARAELAPAGLRRLAPTVLVTSVPGATLLSLLRDCGLAPVAEGPDGHLVAASPAPHRAPQPPLSSPPQVRPDPQEIESIVAAMRAGEQLRVQEEAAPERVGPALPVCDPAVALGLLRRAMAEGETVWVGIAESDGTKARLRFRPTRIAAGMVQGVVEGAGVRTLSVHRVTGVAGDL
ncbi:helicase-associated domain-containing protein [Gephyromycinifex aptenodytis]|uniref:helicase-associated domain-containing protein n=1 Tax=Gephyromycinifex aptenodytis TaxID=2716227 RepID=UPI001445A13E|nr:helicase-associated domain-containing protein [Gephyromycinifex aptenodytis]